LVVALLVLLFVSAIGAGLVLITSVETMIAANFSDAEEARHATEAAAERAAGDLALVSGWDQILSGSVRSPFVDGAPSGTRVLPDGSTIDLTQMLNRANCQKSTTCTSAEMNAVTADRPWGLNNPRWQLYAYGPLANSLPAGRLDSPFYVAVLVADDGSETDNDPLHDGVVNAPGAGILLLRATAFGPRKTQHTLELTVASDRVGSPLHRLSWRELRTSP